MLKNGIVKCNGLPMEVESNGPRYVIIALVMGEGGRRLTVEELVEDVVLQLDHVIQLGDDRRFDARDLVAEVHRVEHVALGFDDQLRSVGGQVGVTGGSGDGDDTSGSDAVVASEEAHPLHRVRVHVQVVSKNDVLGRTRCALLGGRGANGLEGIVSTRGIRTLTRGEKWLLR